VRARQLLGFGMALQEPAPEAARRPGAGDTPRRGSQTLLQYRTVLAKSPSPLGGSQARIIRPDDPARNRHRLEPVAAGLDGDPIAAMRAPLGRRRPAVDQDPGRVDAVAEHGVVDGEQITRRRLHLSRRRPGPR